MDYNDFELAASLVLCFGAALLLVATGVFVHVRRGAKALSWYMFLGILGSLAYGYFAGSLVLAMVPPPYVPGLSEGRGLDLRGMLLILGSWAGGFLGVITTVLTCAISKFVRWKRQRKTAGPIHTPSHMQQ